MHNNRYNVILIYWINYNNGYSNRLGENNKAVLNICCFDICKTKCSCLNHNECLIAYII